MSSFDMQRAAEQIDKKMESVLAKSEQDKRNQLLQYDHEQSQFMRPLAEPKASQANNPQRNALKANKSVVLSKQQVQSSLTQIYNFYSQAYFRPVKELSVFAEMGEQKMNMQAYFLFCKHFRLLKTILNVERLTLIFKKHADYGKSLSFDNFYFMVNSISHEPEAKQFFHLQPITQNLDIETAQQLQKQQLYNYLQLGSPQRYRQCFKQLFLPFNMNQQPKSARMDYHYRKFSLPELRKKAIPEPKERKKGEKDLFILKHDKHMQNNQFDEAKSIVVSWDSLRAKSVNNLGKPAEIIQKKYLKVDPEDDPYLVEVRPVSRGSPKERNPHPQTRENKFLHGGNIEKKIKQIEESESVKNKKILERIQKKLNVKSNRRLQL